MNIFDVKYDESLKSLNIFLSGSINPPIKDFNEGKDWKQWIFKMNTLIKEFGPNVKRIIVTGGEPLDQSPQQFMLFIDAIQEYKKELWLYTKYKIKDIKPVVRRKFANIKSKVDK